MNINISIQKRLQRLEESVAYKDKIPVVIIGTDDDGVIHHEGQQYTEEEFEIFKVEYGVDVVINMGDLLTPYREWEASCANE